MTLSATVNAVCTGCPYWVAPSWQFQHPATVPAGLESASMVYDPVRQQDVLFGGYNNGVHGDTWTFDGTTWTQRTPASAPPARYGAQMAFDTATSSTVLFGGNNGTTNLADTWTWNGTTWTHLTPATSPPARYAGVAAYNAPTSQVVLFGGYSTAVLADTWTWNGTTWTQLSPATSPAARSDAAMAYDPSVQKLVLFGGATTGNAYLGDTWTYSAGAWTQNTTAGGPGNLYGPSLTYDAALGRLVMFGGYSDSAASSQDLSYVYTAGQWGVLGSPVVPDARYHAALAQDPTNGQLVVAGGTDGTSYFGDTHVFDWATAGLQRGYKLEKQNLDDRLSVAVNVAGGNTTITANDLTLPSDGIGLGLTRYYNTRQALQSYTKGYGWFFATGEDLYISNQPDGSKLLAGYAGASYSGAYFHNNGNGTFNTPAGIDADLTVSGTNDIVTYRGSRRVQTFDENNYGAITSDVDRNNNGLHFTYTSGGLTSISDAQGHTASYTYTSGNLTTITDNAGRTVQYGYTSGYLTSVIDLNGKTTSYSYDSSTGELTSITDPNGNITKLAENSREETSSIIRVTNTGAGTGPTTTYTYNPALSTDTGAVLRTLSVAPNYAGSGTGTTYVSNHAAQALKVIDPLGHTRAATYTANAQVATAVDAIGAGNTTTNSYDTDFRATGSTAPTGAASTMTYAETAGTVTSPVAHWQPSAAADPNGNKAAFTYDAPGNVTKAQDTTSGGTGGIAVSYGIYGDAGVASCGGRTGQTGQLCTATDGNGHITTNTYDTSGRLITVTPPSPLGATSYTYDSSGRVATKTDGKSQITRYSYDNDDRVTQLRFAGATTCTSTDITNGVCLTYTYDTDGNRTAQADTTGTTSYGYDTLNRQTSKLLPGTGQTSMTLTYDANSNTLTYTDAVGTTTYAYDAANRLSSLAEPGGSCTSAPTVKCTTFGYNNNDLRTSTTYPTTTATVMTVTPDNSGRVQNIKAVTGATTQSDLSYTYNYTPSGGSNTDGTLARTRVDNTATTGVGKTTTYTYDTLARLTSAIETNSGGSTTASWNYGYDNAGNRTSATINAVANTFGYNNANELTSRNGSGTGFSYDANGNETAAVGATTRTAETWNTKDQLTSSTVAGTATPFTYTGVSQAERTSAGTTTYRSGELGQVAQTTSGTTTSWIRDPAGTLIAQRSSGNSYYYLYDALGSVVGLVNNAGTKVNTYSYDPYGIARTTTEGVGNPYRYTGGYLDSSTGLYKFGIRYYDPAAGRFDQVDPTGKNRGYLYAGGCPSQHVDPSGAAFEYVKQFAEACFGSAVVGAVLGSLAGPEATLPGAVVGCASGVGIEALAALLDATGHPNLADAVRISSGFKDAASLFGLL